MANTQNPLEDLVTLSHEALASEKFVRNVPTAFGMAVKAIQMFYDSQGNEKMPDVAVLFALGNDASGSQLQDYLCSIHLTAHDKRTPLETVADLLAAGLTDERVMQERPKGYESGFKEAFRMLQFFYHPDHANQVISPENAKAKFEKVFEKCSVISDITSEAALGNPLAVKQLVEYARTAKAGKKNREPEKAAYSTFRISGAPFMAVVQNAGTAAESYLRRAAYFATTGDYKSMLDQLGSAKAVAENKAVCAVKTNEIVNGFLQHTYATAGEFTERVRDSIFPGTAKHFNEKIEGIAKVIDSPVAALSDRQKTDNQRKISDVYTHLLDALNSLPEQTYGENAHLEELRAQANIYFGRNFDYKKELASRAQSLNLTNTSHRLLTGRL